MKAQIMFKNYAMKNLANDLQEPNFQFSYLFQLNSVFIQV